MSLREVNTLAWPVPPLYICNGVQHDVTEAGTADPGLLLCTVEISDAHLTAI